MSKVAMENLMKASGEREEGKTPSLGSPNNCIWCQSSYEAAFVSDSKSSKNDFGRMQSYRKKRYKLLLEYLLHKDTVHYSSEHPNEDQHRRHLLIQTLLESRETEEAGAESGTLYQLCPMCEGKADEVVKLHQELEVVQMKLVDKISCLTDAIITNSICGSNEEAKNRMQEMEIWLQHEQDNGDEGIMCEVRRLRNYMDTLMQFQTLIFEGDSKPKSVPCVYLQKCMPISPFSGDETDVAIWNFIKTSTKILPTSSITLDSMSVSNCEQFSSHATLSSEDYPLRTDKREGTRVSRIRGLSRVTKSKAQAKAPTHDDPNVNGSPAVAVVPAMVKSEVVDDFQETSSRYGLRTVHRCKVCHKTFPSMDKLKKHKAIYENEELSNVDYWSEPEVASNYEMPYEDTGAGSELDISKSANLSNPSEDASEYEVSDADSGSDSDNSSTSSNVMAPDEIKTSGHSGVNPVNNDKADKESEIQPTARSNTNSTLTSEENNDEQLNQNMRRTPPPPKVIKLPSSESTGIRIPRSSINPDTGMHKCNVCPLEFKTRTSAWSHYHTVHCKLRYECVMCGMDFLRRWLYVKHYRSIHMDLKLKCDIRNKMSSTTNNLKQRQLPRIKKKRVPRRIKRTTAIEPLRISVNPDTGRFHCPLCPKDFRSYNGFRFHHETIHLKVKHDCLECGKGFTTKTYLTRHHEKFHSDVKTKRHECPVCKKSFSSEQNLKFHQRNANCESDMGLEAAVSQPTKPDSMIPQLNLNPETGLLHCILCWKKFRSTENFQLHFKAVHLEIGYDCSDCSETFVTKQALFDHRKSAHEAEAVGCKFECSVCNKSFMHNCSLKEHQRSTSCGTAIGLETSKPYQKSICSLCGKKFNMIRNLKAHLRDVHEKKRQFPCEHCDKIFKRPQDRSNHTQTIHLGVRFTCEVCKKTFSQKGQLGSHQLRTACGTALGLNQEPAPMNVCHVCGKEYETKFSLKMHLHVVHDAERKYPCKVCGKLFKTMNNVNIHHKGVHLGIRQKQKKRTKKPLT